MRYTARKILTLLVTMLVVSLLTFAAFDMISGDPAATLLGTQATPEKVEALRTEMGLNRPMLVRYGEWLAGFFTGNLGVSFQYRQPVQALLGPKMLVTLCLSLVSFVLIVVVSLPLGLLSANGKLDGLHTFLNQFCMAVPPFFTGILISWCFGIFLRVFVPGDFPGLDRNLGKSLVYLFFAAVSIAIPRVAMTVRMLRSTVYTLLVVAAVAVLLATLFLPVLQVSGDSMNPTLQDRDIILLVKDSDMKTGDLCGFYWQNKLLLKRIIGLPGDVIELDEDGVVTVNGQTLDEPYVDELALGECDIKFPYQVPENRYFVLGDHRATSIDSRSSVIGCVEKSQIVGKVFLRVWPLSSFSLIH